MEEESKSIAVLGIGLIGSYLATLLTKSRSNTYLIARSSIKPKLEQNNGLSVTLLSGETLTVIKEDFEIFSTVSELIDTGITPDYLIVCVKRTAAVEVYNSIKCFDGKNTSIVLMMNGVGALAEAKQILPNNEIIPGMVCRSR
jgi:2-dehydropantoate 2-reductase